MTVLYHRIFLTQVKNWFVWIFAFIVLGILVLRTRTSFICERELDRSTFAVVIYADKFVTMMDYPIIELREVSKKYRLRRTLGELVRFNPKRRVNALKSVNLSINAGEIVCLLGRNGAGKTTLLKIISGIVMPDSGRVYINGRDTGTDPKAFSSVGLVAGDERGFYWRLSGYENLKFFAYLWGLYGAYARQRITEMLEVVGLTDRADDEVRTYSSGMKQRLAIARALISDPTVLLVDELARSLDYPSALDIAAFIKEIVGNGAQRAAIIATHQIWVAKEIASRVVVLDDGDVIADGIPESLFKTVGVRYVVYVEAPPEVVRNAFFSFADVDIRSEGERSRVSFAATTPSMVSEVFERLSGLNVVSVKRDSDEISEGFLQLLRGRSV
jgi:ABC-2 type transport system ATP-binding protein